MKLLRTEREVHYTTKSVEGISRVLQLAPIGLVYFESRAGLCRGSRTILDVSEE